VAWTSSALREGSFSPLLEPRRRIDRAALAVVMQAYVHGTSTRKGDDLVKALGVDSGISKSEVSRSCAELDAEVAARYNPARCCTIHQGWDQQEQTRPRRRRL
jgi:transposase-like protein